MNKKFYYITKEMGCSKTNIPMHNYLGLLNRWAEQDQYPIYTNQFKNIEYEIIFIARNKRHSIPFNYSYYNFITIKRLNTMTSNKQETLYTNWFKIY